MKVNLDTKYYYVINEDLKMSKGKIAAQVSHVAMMLGEKHGEIGRAVVLKAPSRAVLLMSALIGAEYILDAGLTEVPKNSLTCVGFKSIPSDVQKEFMSQFKLV